uniref:Photosystem I assembly protein Ycf4 n=1 Tax=Heterorhabditis bacteriophora TaxID=37862 RepID=A0A1I7WM94_HETBA
MPKQNFTLLDYCGPLAVGGLFTTILFLLSLAMNFLFIRRNDEITAFEKLGAKFNLRVGPHRVSLVKRCTERRIDMD